MANPAGIPNSNVPAPSGAPGGLGSLIENVIQRAFSAVFDAIKDGLAHVIRFGFQTLMEALEPELKEMYGPMLREISEMPEAPESLRHALNTAMSGQYEGGLGVLAGMGQAAGAGAISSLINAPMAGLIYRVNRRYVPWRMSLDIALLAARRDPSRIPFTIGDVLDQGISDNRMAAMIDAMEHRLDPQSLFQLMLRGEMAPDAVRDEMWKQGWNNDAAIAAQKLAQLIPGPADLINMAVREAWDENFAQIGHTDEGLPAEFVEWVGKQGLSADWAKRYWRAHWTLPSPQMGMEMLHRGVIDDSTFDALLKALDISPGWRGKMKAISYSVPTRVDLRRAFRDGIITRAQVRRGYLDAGYNDEWAEILTRWTEVAYAPEEKEVTVSDIRGALERGMLNESEANTYLRELDVGDEAIAFYLAQARFKRAQAIKDTRVDATHKKFVSGKIDRPAASTQLAALGLPGSEIEALLEAWQSEREAKTRDVTYDQLRGFYLDDLVTVEIFRRELGELGYEEESITLYVRAADAQKAREAAAEAERAQKEQERIAKAEAASAYQRAVAAIDVQIAQQRQAIANAQAALNAGMSDEDIRNAQDQIAQLDAQIAAERKQIALIQEARTTALNALDAKLAAVMRQALDAQIGAAEKAIADLNKNIAQINTQIAEAKLLLLGEIAEETQAGIKEDVATWQYNIAQLKEEIEAQRVLITQARNTARAYITDEERQNLERQIRDADLDVRRRNSTIAGYNAQRATIAASIVVSLNDDQRAALKTSIDDARKRISELQVSRAQARVEG